MIKLAQAPVWLVPNVVLAFHGKLISTHGGLPGVRDRNLLASALDRLQNAFHYEDPKPTLFQLAALYAHCIARNHPFVDGNKRTAFLAAAVFLERNGQGLGASEGETVTVFQGLAAGTVDEEDLAVWLEGNCEMRQGLPG